MRRAALSCVLGLFVAVGTVGANDRWDLGTLGDDDGPVSNPNALAHGAQQLHDLQSTGSPPDQDWLPFRVRARHSYEVRVSGTSGVFWSTIDGPPCVAGTCARLERVDASGNVLQVAAMMEGSPLAASLRWFESAAGNAFARVTGPTGTALSASDEYQVEFLDTTYAAARFNNSATQTTVLILQNLKPFLISGSVEFYSGAGTLIDAEPFTLQPAGMAVLNTAAYPPVAGQSGSVLIPHFGGWGALAGKAVAVEPATGFTFDTPFLPLPR